MFSSVSAVLSVSVCPANHERDQIPNEDLIQACRIILNMQRLSLGENSQFATRTPVFELTQITESDIQEDTRASIRSGNDIA